MSVADKRLDDINGGGESPPCIGLISGALPEVGKPVMAGNSQAGVSTSNALSGNDGFAGKRRIEKFRHWYALRTTYGRERKAYEYLIKKKVVAFYPTLTVTRLVNGKKKTVEISRLPNIFFAYGTEDEIKAYVYDNVNLPYLRFYYRKVHAGRMAGKEPLIVPDHQMETFRIICKAGEEDIIVSADEIHKFKIGQTVRVIDGQFKGVIGKVTRYQGQQRVGIVIDGLITIATAYIPKAFIEQLP